ncbi:hypothetical protein [Bacillus sp. 165]|uniref:hypothetical protein n=1 Tax=Bacillus sp. 165 TaxID=1529117 RepID=UPI001ADBF552|nr:hypothetical protein [Bacillus sp. 165]MBO9130325.1 hypothetical protein [Bacillus sp. 165]
MKKTVLASTFHSFIWLGFSLVLFFSQRDKLHSKVILFFVFVYLSYIVANFFFETRRASLLFTLFSALLFFALTGIVTLIIVIMS